MENTPDLKAVAELLGPGLCEVWTRLCASIEEKYDMERIWGKGGKEWQYEYKYRRGGKTLCSLYAREGCMGFMVIFGKAEREKFEQAREAFPLEIQAAYDRARTYHDGKWVMFEPRDASSIPGYMGLLPLKRKPNRK